MNTGLLDAYGIPIQPNPLGLVPIYDIDLTKFPALTTIDLLNIFTSQADDYTILFDGATTQVSNGIPQLVLANAGVPDTGANKYMSTEAAGANSSAINATSYRIVNNIAVLAGDPVGHSFEIVIRNVNDTSVRQKNIWSRSTWTRTTGPTTISSEQSAGVYSSTNAVSGFRLQLSAGNWGATGVLKVYAWRK